MSEAKDTKPEHDSQDSRYNLLGCVGYQDLHVIRIIKQQYKQIFHYSVFEKFSLFFIAFQILFQNVQIESEKLGYELKSQEL